VLGSVYLPEDVPYLARQTALAVGWPDADAYSAECACATGARAVVNGAYQILAGEHEVVVAGGAESLSQRPLYAPPALRSLPELRTDPDLDAVVDLTLRDLLPPPTQVTEPYSGRTLLDHAEEMVRDWGVTRAESDELAVRSQQNATAAWASGRFADEVVPLSPNGNGRVERDALVRPDTTAETVAALQPAEPGGTVTAANASRLTDGGSAVLLRSERAAAAAGKEPRAYLRAWSFTGQDPSLGALIGPAFALGAALAAAGIELDDLDLLDLHEAFAGQVACNLRAMASDEFGREHLGRDGALGTVDVERLNVNGGSVALGHPFGATGGRLVTQSVNELRRRGGRWSAIAICAGGARGAALVFERA
jgi:acetyl-CoA acyltransferase